MKNELKYTTEAEYEEAMVEIDEMMKKDQDDLSEEELHKLEAMALAAQAFEMEHYYEEPPRTLEVSHEARYPC